MLFPGLFDEKKAQKNSIYFKYMKYEGMTCFLMPLLINLMCPNIFY